MGSFTRELRTNSLGDARVLDTRKFRETVKACFLWLAQKERASSMLCALVRVNPPRGRLRASFSSILLLNVCLAELSLRELCFFFLPRAVAGDEMCARDVRVLDISK